MKHGGWQIGRGYAKTPIAWRWGFVTCGFDLKGCYATSRFLRYMPPKPRNPEPNNHRVVGSGTGVEVASTSPPPFAFSEAKSRYVLLPVLTVVNVPPELPDAASVLPRVPSIFE